MPESITNLSLMTEVSEDILYRMKAAGSSCGHNISPCYTLLDTEGGLGSSPDPSNALQGL